MIAGAAVIVWISVTVALRPLYKLGDAIGERSPDDLHPIKQTVPSEVEPLVDTVNSFMVAADFDAYAQAQREVDQIWTNQSAWYTKTINNTARMGWFSSDRTIRQYADEIWRAG